MTTLPYRKHLGLWCTARIQATMFGFWMAVLLYACNSASPLENACRVSGKVDPECRFVLLDGDTTWVHAGLFSDTILLEQERYGYIHADGWAWPKLMLMRPGQTQRLNLSQEALSAPGNPINGFLLHSDSILVPYTLRWDMPVEAFEQTLVSELDRNHRRIDSVFAGGEISETHLQDLKDIERLKVAHRTANFIAYQERNGVAIDRSIYGFLEGVDLNNARLENQINNRNFQYFYLMDKVDSELPDSVFPFAVIDTVLLHSNLESIQKMLIASAIKASFYAEGVDHAGLLERYETLFGALPANSDLMLRYQVSRALLPGNPAPSIGALSDREGRLWSIDDFKGRHILLSVWGTWCPHCAQELPYIQKLLKQHGNKLTSVGIALDQDEEAWKAFLDANEWPGVHLIDPDRKSTFRSNYLIRGTNVHLLIDREGRIVSPRGVLPSSEELNRLVKGLAP